MSVILKFEFFEPDEAEADWLEEMGISPKVERILVIHGVSEVLQANWGSIPPLDIYLAEECKKTEVDSKSYTSSTLENIEGPYGGYTSVLSKTKTIVLKGGQRRINRMTEDIEKIIYGIGGSIKIEDKDVQ